MDKGLKGAPFWGIKSQNLPRPARRKLIRREKISISKEGGGGMIEMHKIYPCREKKKTYTPLSAGDARSRLST